MPAPVSISESAESAPAVCDVSVNDPPTCAKPATSTDSVPAAATVTVPSSAFTDAGTMSLTVDVDQLKPSGFAVNDPALTDSVSADVPVTIEPAMPEPWTATCSMPPIVATATSTSPDAPMPSEPFVTTPFVTEPPTPTKMPTPISEIESAESVPAVCVVSANVPPACAKPAT